MSNSLSLVIYQKMSTEDISNLICRLVSQNDPSPEGLILATELIDILEIRRLSDNFDTESYEEDILYDEVSSGLLIHDMKIKRKELLEALSMYYRVFVLQEPFEEV